MTELTEPTFAENMATLRAYNAANRAAASTGSAARFYEGLLDLFERRVSILFAKTGKDWRHMVGPVYDPTKGSSGDGWPCPKCRKVSPTGTRVCGSCGAILPLGGAR